MDEHGRRAESDVRKRIVAGAERISPPTAPPLAEVVRRGRTRRRLRVVGTSAVAVALVGSLTWAGLSLSGMRHGRPSGTTSAPTSPLPLELGASGLVIARSPTDVVLVGGPCELAFVSAPPSCAEPLIRVVGVDLSALSHRQTGHAGAIWGDAYLAGTIVDGTLHVTEQGPPKPSTHGPIHTDPPCSAPAGGWAINYGRSTAADAYARQHPEEITALDLFYAGPRRWVNTIASTDPAHTMSSLTKDYPNGLCVVRSRYSRDDVHHAAAVARRLFTPQTAGKPPDEVTNVTANIGPDGQPLIEVDVVFDNSFVHQALASLPAGLIEIVPWLRPVAG